MDSRKIIKAIEAAGWSHVATTDAVAFLVDVPSKPARSVRLNIMLPEDLVREIDRATTNRSRFLAEAARAKLAA